MRARAEWSVRALHQRCQRLREALEARGAQPEALAAYWPGGAENTHRGRGAWVYAYAQLVRLTGETDLRRQMASAGGGEADLLAALAAEPVAVTVTGVPAGETAPAQRHAHPKSYAALRWLARDDTLLGAVLGQLDLLPVPRSPADQDLADRALAASIGVQQRMAWAALHPGPDLPFDPLAETPDPPPKITALTPMDLVAVLRAYRQANQRGLMALPRLTGAEPGGRDRPTWAMFFATVAQDRGGIAPEELMRERPLDQLIVQARLARLARTPAEAGA